MRPEDGGGMPSRSECEPYCHGDYEWMGVTVMAGHPYVFPNSAFGVPNHAPDVPAEGSGSIPAAGRELAVR